ncbi:MAG TPA: NifU family protein [Vicinamibacterales bacterium]|nr:NifU family protein [Vicinamibacterales bacterium]
MVSTTQVEVVLSDIRPFLQSDGVDIEVLAMDGNSALAHLSLPSDTSAGTLLTLWTEIEQGLRERIPDFEALRLV